MSARLKIVDLPERYQNQVAKLLYGNTQPNSPASNPKPECSLGDGTLAAPQAKAGHSGKYLVLLKSYRTRLLDEDNLVPKWHVDALRYAGILPADTPAVAHIEVCQEKVPHRKDERTEITITCP